MSRATGRAVRDRITARLAPVPIKLTHYQFFPLGANNEIVRRRAS